MPEDLSRLARELRKENCPRRVIDEAVRRIAAETPPPGRRYPIAATLALAGAMLLCGLLVRWRLTSDSAGKQPQWVEQQAQRRLQVAREAETALGLIGTVLLDAGAHSETVISDRAIPPLRNGLQTAKNKITRHTEL
jgi:hypothetical protein